ncbi:DUF4834 family protein [Puia sp.]|jgi:hypothetical protein|uniref:DUF4834 family protein n=1 Tax=Puia sp. TaxID=2045100 RepID=UPI002F418962
MALSEIFLFAIVFYLLYRFVFNFLVPVARTTRHVRQQFRNMNDMQETMRQQQARGENQGPPQQAQSASRQRSDQKPSVGDYIDFEEIKD